MSATVFARFKRRVTGSTAAARRRVLAAWNAVSPDLNDGFVVAGLIGLGVALGMVDIRLGIGVPSGILLAVGIWGAR